MLEMLFITAYVLVVSILFVTTLSIIKQFGLIKSLLAMVVLVSVALLAVYTINTLIVYLLIKMLIMWLVVV
jgi:hypothetical protein